MHGGQRYHDVYVQRGLIERSEIETLCFGCLLGTSADDDVMAAGDIDEEVEGIYTKAVYLTGRHRRDKDLCYLDENGQMQLRGLPNSTAESCKQGGDHDC